MLTNIDPTKLVIRDGTVWCMEEMLQINAVDQAKFEWCIKLIVKFCTKPNAHFNSRTGDWVILQGYEENCYYIGLHKIFIEQFPYSKILTVYDITAIM